MVTIHKHMLIIYLPVLCVVNIGSIFRLRNKISIQFEVLPCFLAAG